MLFNSYIFIFAFLPLALLGWYGLNKRKKYRFSLAFLCGMSFWFYAWFNVYYFFLLLFSIAMNFGLSFLIGKAEEKSGEKGLTTGTRRLFLLIGVGANLAIFFYFKYWDFFTENINAIFRTDFTLRNILLPLGISFFTFQQLSYIIDRAKGEARHYPLLYYVTYVTFFPQLIAGPIVLHEEMVPQLMDTSKRSFDEEKFRQGIYLFVIGLSKKVLLADTLSGIVDYGFEKTYYLEFWTTALVVVSYAFQLYFDFSGYSDMAIGLGKMFGFELPVNFNSPYKSRSITELWRRWHITLTRFFMKYVYFPLGGSRKGSKRTYLNIFIVFAISGLWHGAAWTFIIWGMLQGLFVIFERAVGQEKLSRIPDRLRLVLTFVLFCATLIFFRADTVEIALQMFRNLGNFTFPGYLLLVAEKFAPTELYVVRKAFELFKPDFVKIYSLTAWLLVLFLSGYVVFFRKNALTMMKESRFGKRTALFLSILFAWSVISFSGVNSFLYFNF